MTGVPEFKITSHSEPLFEFLSGHFVFLISHFWRFFCKGYDYGGKAHFGKGY